jgi:hypothetical protein
MVMTWGGEGIGWFMGLLHRRRAARIGHVLPPFSHSGAGWTGGVGYEGNDPDSTGASPGTGRRHSVNVQDGLKEIRQRLADNDADPATLKLVDAIGKRAALPAAASAASASHLQIVRLLMRTPVASENPKVYNDLVGLEQELEERGVEFRERQAAEDAKPMPKLKKYYKQKK